MSSLFHNKVGAPHIEKPVRRITSAFVNPTVVRNKLYALGYRKLPRHTSLNKLLGGLPKPVLQALAAGL